MEDHAVDEFRYAMMSRPFLAADHASNIEDRNPYRVSNAFKFSEFAGLSHHARKSTYQLQREAIMLEGEIAARIATARALGLPSDGVEVEKIMELTKRLDAVRELLPSRPPVVTEDYATHIHRRTHPPQAAGRAGPGSRADCRRRGSLSSIISSGSQSSMTNRVLSTRRGAVG